MSSRCITVRRKRGRKRACHDLRFRLNVRLGCGVPRPWPCTNVAFEATGVLSVVNPLARGLSGDNALDGGRIGRASVFSALFPVARRRTGGLPVPLTTPGPFERSVVLDPTPRRGTNSSVFDVPSACRRAFSCLFWTVRK